MTLSVRPGGKNATIHGMLEHASKGHELYPSIYIGGVEAAVHLKDRSSNIGAAFRTILSRSQI